MFIKKTSLDQYFFLLSLAIIFLGVIFFDQRELNAVSLIHSLGVDEQNYIKLSSGDSDVVKLHACRVLMPFIASKLPFDPARSIYLINVLSFFFLIFYICKILNQFLISKKVIIFSVFITSFTLSVAYNFTNLYLTDLPGMCCMTIYLYSIINKRYYSSLFWMGTSLLFRETAIVFLPLFFIIFSKRKIIFASLFALIIYIIPKLIISQNIHCGFENKMEIRFLLEYKFLAKTFLSYTFIIFLGLLGFFELRKLKGHLFRAVILILIFGILGGFLSSLKSYTDVTRMYFILYPIIVLGLAFVINRIINLKYMFIKLFFLFISTTVSTTGLLPNFFISGEFNSLQKFAESNSSIIIFSICVQGIISLMIIYDYLKETKLIHKTFEK
jgi:hypothetical protein